MSTHEVWKATLDKGNWVVTVHGDDDNWYRGVLLVADKDGTVIHREVVPIGYGAKFGPDADDVRFWQERTLEVIDNPTKREPSEPSPSPEQEPADPPATA